MYFALKNKKESFNIEHLQFNKYNNEQVRVKVIMKRCLQFVIDEDAID